MSHNVWSSVIGVILGSLSLGYWLGGRISAANPSRTGLAAVIFLSAAAIFIAALGRGAVLQAAEGVAAATDLRWGAFFAALVLFFLPNLLLGVVSPYAARLRIVQVENCGQVVGNLYAISTIGSIAGTFLAGFWLLGAFGSEQINLWTAAILVLVSLAVDPERFRFFRIGLFLVIAAWSLAGASIGERDAIKTFDTYFGRYMIKDTKVSSDKTMRELTGDKFGIQSAMFLNGSNPSDELVFGYTKYFLLGRYFNPNIRHSLMIGGGAYSFPKKYLSLYPEGTMDVVEIDPELTRIAQKYFFLKDDVRMSIFHEDGRVFLNHNRAKYGCIYVDAYSSLSIPFHLTTRQAVQKMYEAVDDGGVVLANVISAADGDKGKVLRSIYATYKSVFPQVYVFAVNAARPRDEAANYVLAALKAKDEPKWNSDDAQLDGFLKNRTDIAISADAPINTDDFAPMDEYVLEIVKDI